MPQKLVWTCRLCVAGESICVASTLFHPQSSHHTQNKSGTWCQGGTWGVWDENIYDVTLFLLQRYLARSYCFLKVLSQWTQGRDRWSVPASCAATWDRNLLAIWRKITHCLKVAVKNTTSIFRTDQNNKYLEGPITVWTSHTSKLFGVVASLVLLQLVLWHANLATPEKFHNNNNNILFCCKW